MYMSFLYVCMVNTIYLLSFVETQIYINLRGVSTKLNKYNMYITRALNGRKPCLDEAIQTRKSKLLSQELARLSCCF